MKKGCWVTPSGGNPRESATEKRLPWCAASLRGSMAMVKRWGKSPPRSWQQERLGKPHPEQRRIGTLRGKVRDEGRKPRQRRPPQGDFSPEVRVGSLTALVTSAAEEWSSKGGTPGQNPAYRPSAHLQHLLWPDRGTLCGRYFCKYESAFFHTGKNTSAGGTDLCVKNGVCLLTLGG